MTTEPGRRYRLTSADSHVNEPPDLWTSRVAAAFADRAPRIERFDEGDAWVIEGVADPINFGMNACAGLEPEAMRGWVRFEDIRRGGHDPAARLVEMDRDDVDAEVLYPPPRLAQAVFANPDPEYRAAMIGAYNDWISEYVEYAPERFGGLAMLPNSGAEAAVAEIDRTLERPGMRGVVMGTYPNGSLQPDPTDDKVWGRLAERQVPLGIHVSLAARMPTAHSAKLPGYGRFFDAPNRMIEMIFAGIFDRFPTLQMVAVESGVGWIPFILETMNYELLEHAPKHAAELSKLPSEYFRSNWYATFWFEENQGDVQGLFDKVGDDRVLFETDFPHPTCLYPDSLEVAARGLAVLDPEAQRKILSSNAAQLYSIPLRAAVA